MVYGDCIWALYRGGSSLLSSGMSWSDDFRGSDKTPRGLLVAKVGVEVGTTMGDGGDGRRAWTPIRSSDPKSTGVCLEEV